MQDTKTPPPTAYLPPTLTDLGDLRPGTRGGGGSRIETRQKNKPDYK